MSDNASLEAICETMKDHRNGFPFVLVFRRPVAYFLLNNLVWARGTLRNELQALGNRTDPYAKRYRRFAAAFSTRLSGDGPAPSR